MPYGQCTARVTGQHRTSSGRARCPVHGAGGSFSQGAGTRTQPAWPTSRGIPTTPTPASRNYGGRYHLIRQLSEQVVILMLSEPDDQLRDATFALIDALTPPGKSVSRTGHVLCDLFEQVALEFQNLLAAPGAAIEGLVGERVAGSEVLSGAAGALLKHAAQCAMANAVTPLSVLHVQACACALAFCPDASEHRSLEKNCGIPFLKAAGADH